MLDPNFHYLNIPGFEGSGDLHWQTFWEHNISNITRLEQEDWDNPEKDKWVKKLFDTLDHYTGKPIILVGHSLGGGVVVHAAAQRKLPWVAGAFLVGFPDIERPDFPKAITGFAPVPRIPLPFPTLLVSSENDPFIQESEMLQWAKIFGASTVSVGKKLHMGSDAELGLWEEGQMLLSNFTKSIK